MIRNVDMNEISDGNLYSSDSVAKIGTCGCVGCHKCCTGMGDSLVLDPYDIFMLCKGLNTSFTALLNKHIALSVVDSIILPHINMDNENECCSFLGDDKRCQIHDIRPGFCRLFPLGRIYKDNGEFDYFVQINECPFPDKTKTKIKKWLGIENLRSYEKFITDWRNYLHQKRQEIAEASDDAKIKDINMNLLNTFFLAPYNYDNDFYEQFYNKLIK